jgi:hypothetical protein
MNQIISKHRINVKRVSGETNEFLVQNSSLDMGEQIIKEPQLEAAHFREFLSERDLFIQQNKRRSS